MTGADIIGALLRDDAAAIGVPVANIKGGRLPDNVTLPALLVRTVSVTEYQTLTRGPFVRNTDRVAVTVRAASYDDQVNIIEAVRKRHAGRTGDIGGALRVSLLSAGTGPDLNGPGNSFEQTQDFRVSHDTPA